MMHIRISIFIKYAIYIVTTLVCSSTAASPLDSLETMLRNHPQIQEKIYIHKDNSCYFVGDTLWYKAYVVRSDNLSPTDMSRVAYVELLTPDGYLVERQILDIDSMGCGYGQFVLEDSLYSGYYELRAYTRWNLNFNWHEVRHSRDDILKFYDKQHAKDFYRCFDGLYSQVFPVYEKPQTTGDYTERYMRERPKQRVNSVKKKQKLNMQLYPEGGNCVDGLSCRCAFEITDEDGRGVRTEGFVNDSLKIISDVDGRGYFEFTPMMDNKIKVVFEGVAYSFKLPNIDSRGVSIRYDAETSLLRLRCVGVEPAAYSVRCGGKLMYFQRLLNGEDLISIDTATCRTGINEIIVYDSLAIPLASRLIFVNKHDKARRISLVLKGGAKETHQENRISQYERLTAELSSDNNAVYSIAVCDTSGDHPSYDDGNMLTDMVLSSELRGFIAHPHYYFEVNDSVHRAALDLLMMVQGWRRYERVEEIRYQPEKGLTYEGTINKLPNIGPVPRVYGVMNDKCGMYFGLLYKNHNSGDIVDNMIGDMEAKEIEQVEDVYSDYTWSTVNKGDKGNIRKEAVVDAQLVLGADINNMVVRTSEGRFCFDIPSFYGYGVLFVRAYPGSQSSRYKVSRRIDSGWMDDTDYPHYYVKRDMFFPVYSTPYSWYQTHQPHTYTQENTSTKPMLSKDGILPNVEIVKRRGKRAIDFRYPAYKRDFYDLYNDVTDYGLSWGMYSAHLFPIQVSTFLFGNMGMYRSFNVRAMVLGHSYFRNYDIQKFEKNEQEGPMLTESEVYSKTSMHRIKNIKVFSDYNLRENIGVVSEISSAQATIEIENYDGDQARYTYRDRRYIFNGFTYPWRCYSPDYSKIKPTAPTDYRRTLYWKPDISLKEGEVFTDVIYGNSRMTKYKVTACGLGADGMIYYYDEK